MATRKTTRKTSSSRASSRKATSRKKARKAPSKRAAASSRASGTPRKRATERKPATRKWSKGVTETSDAMDLENSVFKLRSARAIASSLKRSAERSGRRKSPPYRSALSMLTFYVNRAGHNLKPAQRDKLERAKDELRKLFGRA